MSIDLSTRYLGLQLRTPLVASPSPLTGDLDGAKRLVEAGVGALVLPSLFEEEILHEELELTRALEAGTDQFPEALDFFPAVDGIVGASLVEPGSFDPDVMATERYLGVSMFAVFPGPMSAPLAFDELVATGRRLAERLGAMLQDDAGHSLTGQRLVTMREELVNFENLAQRVRPGRRD